MPTEVTLPDTGVVTMTAGTHENTWGDQINANFVLIDALFDGTTGHDHSVDGKGTPIPTAGAKGLTSTSAGLVRADGSGNFALATYGAGLSFASGILSLSIHTVTEKTTPVDADELLLADSAATYVPKMVKRENLLKGALLAGTPFAFQNIGAASGAQALAANLYGVFSLTANGNTTLSITGAVTGKAYLVTLILTNGGSFTITDPSGTKWPGGARPALSAAGTDVLFFLSVDGGTTWRATAEIDSR